MSQFYDVDTRKISYAEIWSDAKLLSPVVWFAKWFRIRLPCSMDDPPVDSILPFVAESLPEFVTAQFQLQYDALASLGFHSPVYQVIRDPGTQTTVFWATFLHESGIHYARVQLRHWDKGINAKRKPYITFFTGFLHGTFLATSAGKPDSKMPTTVDLKFKTGAASEKLWALHEQRIADSGRLDFAGVSNREELLWSLERHHLLIRDFNLARGVFCQRDEKSQAVADANQSRYDRAAADGYEHADVLAQVIELQEKKPKWTSALWILVLSGVAFLAGGSAMWDWKFTLWLIPVLLFHEAGHWVAMRIFKYRNLRMFFIPFFGAAVTGQNWNVPGWKKALVSLAGPMPGIFLGAVLAVVTIFVKVAWLNKLAMILLVLNGINLLPVLPLDGGRVLHSILFCRHRWMDVAFRVMAMLGLIGIAMMGSGQLMIPLIVIMVITLPVAFKLAKVTDELRYADLPAPLPDEDRIPTQTAQTIISAIKPVLPKKTSNKICAQHTVNVFETLNAEPPGVLATLGLMATQGLGLVMAIGFGVLLVFTKQGGLKDFMSAAVRQPTHQFRCADISTWRGEQAVEATQEQRSVIIATFENRTRAMSEFAAMTNKLPTNARLMLFGESLLLSLPMKDEDTRDKWFDKLESSSKNVLVIGTNRSVSITLQFLPPTSESASNITHLMQGYLGKSAQMRLIAPWSPAAKGAEFEAFVKQRGDWSRIEKAMSEVWKDPEMKTLSRKMTAARRRDSAKELRKLQDEQEKLTAELRDRNRESLRTSETDPVDAELLNLHARLEKLNYTNRVERAELNRQIGVKLGSVKLRDGDDAKSRDPLGASMGSASQHGLLVEVNWLALNNPEIGLPAFVEWLCGQDCKSIKYDLQSGFMGLGDYTESDEADGE